MNCCGAATVKAVMTLRAFCATCFAGIYLPRGIDRWTPEIKPLQTINSDACQPMRSRFGFDGFGNSIHAEMFRNRKQSLRQDLIVRIRLDATDKLAINFKNIKPELLQMSKEVTPEPKSSIAKLILFCMSTINLLTNSAQALPSFQ